MKNDSSFSYGLFDEVRIKILDGLVVAMGFAYIPSMFFLAFRIRIEGLLLTHVLHIALYCFFVAFLFLKNRIPYFLRAFIALGTWWISAASTLVIVGPGSDGKSILAIIVMLSIFLLPIKIGIGFLIAEVLTIGALGIAVVWGGWVFLVDYAVRMHNPLTWVFSSYNIGLSSGIAAYAIWVAVDTLKKTVNESQERAKKLNQALQRQKAISASSNAAMCILRDGLFVEVNDYLARLVGYSPAELVGNPARMLHIDDEHYEAFRKAIDEPLREKGSVSLEYPFRHRNGCWVWAYLSITALEHEIVLVGIDISELRLAREEAESASRAKSIFLANISHELRTPLNAVLGFAQVMEAAPNLDVRQKSHLEAIQMGGQHLRALINDLLDLAKIEDGSFESRSGPSSPQVFFEEVVRLFSVRASEKGIDISFSMKGYMPLVLVFDERHLRQVLMNLLVNAVKFTDRGRVDLSASYAEGLLIIEVSDTGIGIHPDEIPFIFERFHQVAPHTHVSQGTGLGLSISQRLVLLMGGHLEVSSKLGDGSVFRIELPVGVGDPNGTHAIHESSELHSCGMVFSHFRATQAAKGLVAQALVVDDVMLNRMLMAALLQPVGFEVAEAATGLNAIELVKRNEPDVVLIDLRLPDISGLETTRRLRRLGYNGVIVMVSASAFEADCSDSLEAGCDAFVAKPVDIFELVSVLERFGKIERIDQQPVCEMNFSHGRSGQSETVDHALFDLAVIERNKQLIPAPRLAEISDEFEEQSCLRIVRIEDALCHGCLDDAVHEIHQLAGGAGMLGLRQLQLFCVQLERQLVNDGGRGDSKGIDALQTIHKASVDALKNLKRNKCDS